MPFRPFRALSNLFLDPGFRFAPPWALLSRAFSVPFLTPYALGCVGRPCRRLLLLLTHGAVGLCGIMGAGIGGENDGSG